MDQYTLTYYYRETEHLKRKDGTYPVQLAIYDRNTSTTRYLMTKFGFETKSHFLAVTEGRPKTKRDKEIKREMDVYLNEVNEKAKSLRIFSIPEFKNVLKKKLIINETVTDFYLNKISEYKDNGQIGTASNYECSLQSLQAFRKAHRKTTIFHFHEVTVKFLEQYERWMLNEGKSPTTIGIYLRPLRSIFNDALSASKDVLYPFHTKGNAGYKIPGSKKTNKSLSGADVKTLFEGITITDHEAKAKAFFFFSYLSNGMNVKDIVLLKKKNVFDDHFTFVRAKTALTTKSAQQVIEVVMLDYQKEVIAKYGNYENSEFVFPIVEKSMSDEIQHRKIQAFNRFINQHMKNYAKRIGVTGDISSVFARHTFSTVMMQDNVSLEYIRQSLGHQSLTTTQHYLGTFESKNKKENANKLLNF